MGVGKPHLADPRDAAQIAAVHHRKEQVAKQRLARHKNRIIRQLAERYEETFDDPDFYLEGELVQRLTEALRKMPPEFRQTFRMHRLEGMTHKEIAVRLNVSPQTVNYRIGQTVRLLREELSDYWPLLVLLLWPDLS